MIRIGASVVDVTGAGAVAECPNQVLQGAFPQDIASAISGTRAPLDQVVAALASPAIPGVFG